MSHPHPGAGGGWIGFSTDDVDALHAELVTKGVEITQPPTDMSDGRDMGLRDPFGNNLRIGKIDQSAWSDGAPAQP